MGVSSGRSRVADLEFRVFGRALHPDWYATRAHRRYARAAWRADVRIIDGGHAIDWTWGRVRLTEVLVGPAVALPEVGLLYGAPVRHERDTDLRPADGVEYQACFEAERLDREVFLHICDELILDAGANGLFHRFAPPTRLAPPPISRVHVEARKQGLSIHTFHTFPEEYAIVRTQSLFEVAAPAPR